MRLELGQRYGLAMTAKARFAWQMSRACCRALRDSRAALLSSPFCPKFRRAQRTAPRNRPAIVRAESAMDQQQWSEAEAILRKLVAANAKDARAWFDLGYVMHAAAELSGGNSRLSRRGCGPARQL